MTRKINLFIWLWAKAQKNRDVARMEQLLEHRWFRLWWWIFISGWPNGLHSTAKAAVERILQEKGMIPTPPERPSERAMRIATEARP